MSTSPPPQPESDPRLQRDVAIAVAAAVVGAIGGAIGDLAGVLGGGALAGGAIGALLLGVMGTVWVALEYRRDAQEAKDGLSRAYHFDRLTGLANHRLMPLALENQLAIGRRNQTRVGLLLVDVDRFTRINEVHGREAGDQLMVDVVDRIKSAMRPDDMLLRVGGTRFAVISPAVSDATAAQQIANRIVKALEPPHELGHDLVSIPASIGIALTEQRSSRLEDVLQDADIAAHRARAAGPGAVALFAQSMLSELTPANAERRLREALDRGEFHLLYQPMFDLQTRRLVGVEALLRWIHPSRGVVGPNDFLPAMEETGLIVPVGAWVLGEACRQARHWREQFPNHPPFDVMVNVSARQLVQSDFLDVLSRAASTTGTEASILCLEVTEETLRYDIDAAWAMLRHGKQLGVRVALDDFGTRSSSISSVRSFKLDGLKIAKSFIDGLGLAAEDTAIVRHLVALADELGVTAVAQGVEDERQAAELVRLGCRYAQGYHFSHPVTPAEIDDMLDGSVTPGQPAAEPIQTAAPEPLPQRDPGAQVPTDTVTPRPLGEPVPTREREPRPVVVPAPPTADDGTLLRRIDLFK